jgi:ABC-type multidrug transport system fused ATPase/permease subunit
MKRAFRENRVKNAEISAQAEESLGGIRIVKAFAQEAYELQQFVQRNQEYLAARCEAYKILGNFSSSISFLYEHDESDRPVSGRHDDRRPGDSGQRFCGLFVVRERLYETLVTG